MANLQMVAGKQYASKPIFGQKVVQLGEVVSVENEAHANHLINQTFLDALNNEHRYFVETDLPVGPARTSRKAAPAPVVEDDEDDAPAPVRRRTVKAKSKAGQED